ncbi:MAG: hypothetical protein IJ310_01295 [Clostridia bacterium]|nr:hypothetical protein [Clostridia bacterium]
MSLNPIKAILKLGARKISDASYNKEERKVQNSTYAQVGKKIKRAQKQGQYFDASKEYQNTYKRNMRPVDQKKIRRDKFIDEI